MKTDEYIKSVCEQNRLTDTAEWLIHSADDVYYADRHILPPEEGVPKTAAIQAGLALLVQWVGELGVLRQRGLAASNPLLVVDNEWIEERRDAPPPHILIAISKKGHLITPQKLSGRSVDYSYAPFSSLFSGALRNAVVSKVEPSQDRESRGSWVIQLPVQQVD